MQFCYLVTRWEKWVYNNKLLKDILFIKNFIILEKKYYLVDAGYYNTNYFLYFYHSIWYYLKKEVIAS